MTVGVIDLGTIEFPPVQHDILIEHLRTHSQDRIQAAGGVALEVRPEDYVVRRLIDFGDVSYDDHADLLYDLAGQVVTHLRGYLPDEEAVLGVLQFYQKQLAELVHAQMQAHYETPMATYEGNVTRGFITLRSMTYTLPHGETVRDFKAPLEAKAPIPSLLFGGFGRCLYTAQRFHSLPELAFAAVLEADPEVLRWVKPGPGAFQIHYRGDAAYEPDFVVETNTEKLICEVKAAAELTDPFVADKTRAALTWCRHASEHARAHDAKPWRYILMPHDEIGPNRTLSGLIARFARSLPGGSP